MNTSYLHSQIPLPLYRNNTVLLDQSLKSSLKITLCERITDEFFSPCGKRIRYQRHVISIKWRKNDETKHLNISTTFFTFLKNGSVHQLLRIYWTLFQEPFCFHPKLFCSPLLPRSSLISVTQLTMRSSLYN